MDNNKKRIGDFIGFYPSRPYWACSEIDFTKPENLEHFTELMSEEVFEESNDKFTLKICRDGMIMLRVIWIELNGSDDVNLSPIERTVALWGEYLDYLNCYYLLLDSVTLSVMNLSHFSLHEITNRDAFRITYKDGKNIGVTISGESYASVFQMGRYKSSYAVGVPIHYDSRFVGRLKIPCQVFEAATNIFSMVFDNSQAVKQLSSISKSICEYKVGNYDTSIVLAWFVIESVISNKWENYITSKNIEYPNGKLRINSERRQYFAGRDYPISVVSNMLEIADVISFELFQDIDKVRGYRNKVVHQSADYRCMAKHCQLAINTALKIALEDYEFDVIPGLSYSIIGL